jgi:hypothetical protein
MNTSNKLSKADLLDTLRCGFDILRLDSKGTAYVPDPIKLAVMAERIRIKAEEDPTRLGGETLEDIRPNA